MGKHALGLMMKEMIADFFQDFKQGAMQEMVSLHQQKKMRMDELDDYEEGANENLEQDEARNEERLGSDEEDREDMRHSDDDLATTGVVGAGERNTQNEGNRKVNKNGEETMMEDQSGATFANLICRPARTTCLCKSPNEKNTCRKGLLGSWTPLGERGWAR